MGSSLKEEWDNVNCIWKKATLRCISDSENTIKRDARCFGTNTPSLDKHTHTTKGWWPAVTFVLWRLLCHGGWGQENDSPDTNRQSELNKHVISTQCPAEPLFPISTLSGDNNELLCTKTNYIFWKSTLQAMQNWQSGKQITPQPSAILSVSSVNSQILYDLSAFMGILVFAVKIVLKYVSLLYLLTYINTIYQASIVLLYCHFLNMDTHAI